MAHHLLSIDFDVCDVVLENCWHVNFWELILAEDDQETSLSAGAVTDDDQLLTNGSHFEGSSIDSKNK
jgi:hypothetical protein